MLALLAQASEIEDGHELQATFLEEAEKKAENPTLQEELSALDDESLATKCRRNGLSRTGDRSAQIQRIINLQAYLSGDRQAEALKPLPVPRLATPVNLLLASLALPPHPYFLFFPCSSSFPFLLLKYLEYCGVSCTFSLSHIMYLCLSLKIVEGQAVLLFSVHRYVFAFCPYSCIVLFRLHMLVSCSMS